MERKQQIRKQHLSERSALSESVAEQLSAQISAYCREYLTGQNNLREHGVYGYYPLKKEVSFITSVCMAVSRACAVSISKGMR